MLFFFQVNIIYSYSNREDSCPDYVTSGTEELQYLATISGGLFIELEEFDASDIDGIMQQGVDENKVHSIWKLSCFSFSTNFSLSTLCQRKDFIKESHMGKV